MLLASCASTAPAGGELCVLTWNVLYLNTHHADTARLIGESGADIVCLQEVTPDLETALRRDLAGLYPAMVFDAVPRAGSGTAVLSKFAFEVSRRVPHPYGTLHAHRVRVRTPLGPVQVLNVHLTAPRVLSGTAVERLHAYSRTAAVRDRELRHFCGDLESGVPAIVAGDFNSLENESDIVYLKETLGLVDVYRILHPRRSDEGTTWRAHGDDDTLIRARIDYIFASPDLAASEAAVLRSCASDHWPVRAVFR